MNTQLRSWARAALLLALLAPLSLLAQDQPQPSTPPPSDSQAEAATPPPAPVSPPAPATTPDPPAPKVNPLDKELRDEVPKRIFWIIPNFMTANDVEENQGPLTPREK